MNDAAGVPAATPAPKAEEHPGQTAAPTIAISTSPQPSHTTKVRIDTPGVSVEIETRAALDVVARTALQLFHEAGGWPQETTHSAGFASAERRDSPPVQPSSMDWAPGGYPVQSP